VVVHQGPVRTGGASPSPHRGFKPQPVQLETSHYTENAVPAAHFSTMNLDVIFPIFFSIFELPHSRQFSCNVFICTRMTGLLYPPQFDDDDYDDDDDDNDDDDDDDNNNNNNKP
jgi:hypothetical protein